MIDEKNDKQQLINDKYRCKAIDDDDDDDDEEEEEEEAESSGNLHKSTVWLTSEVAKRSTPSPSSTVSASNTRPSASKRCTSASNGDVIGIFYLCSIEMIEENCLKEIAKIHLSNGSFINSQSCLRAENGEFSGVCLESPTEKGCCKKSWSVVVAMNHGGFCPLAICHRSTQPPWAYNFLDHPLCICTFCKMILCTSGYIYRNLPLPPAVPAPQPHQSLLLPFGLSTAALLSDSMWRFPSRSKRLGKNRHISGSLQF